MATKRLIPTQKKPETPVEDQANLEVSSQTEADTQETEETKVEQTQDVVEEKTEIVEDKKPEVEVKSKPIEAPKKDNSKIVPVVKQEKLAYGNLDTDKKYPFPAKWLETPRDIVVVHQVSKNFDNESLTRTWAHQTPIQAYTLSEYLHLNEVVHEDGLGNSITRFNQLGIEATPIHNGTRD